MEVFRGSSSFKFGQFEESVAPPPQNQRIFFLQKMDYYRDPQLAKTYVTVGCPTPADTSQDNPTPKAQGKLQRSQKDCKC